MCGFDRTSSARPVRPITRSGVSYRLGSFGVYGERDIRVDATRESGIRRRIVLFGVSGLALGGISLYSSMQQWTPRWLTFAPALAAGLLLAGVIISLGSGSFWSELVLVYCNPMGIVPDKEGSPSEGWRVDVRAAVIRSANWAAKSSAGRSVKEAHRDPSLTEALNSIVLRLRGPTDPLLE